MKEVLYVDYSQVKKKFFKVILDDCLIKNYQKKSKTNLRECFPNYFWDNANIKNESGLFQNPASITGFEDRIILIGQSNIFNQSYLPYQYLNLS